MRRVQIVIVLAFFTLGSGPCDVFDPPIPLDSEMDGSVACEETDCTDTLTVEVIRADNSAFFICAYRFSVLFADASESWIECYLPYVEAGLNCDAGDLQLMSSQLGSYGQTIWVQVRFAAQALRLTVEYNGSPIGQRDMWPQYEEVDSTDPDCPSACVEAKESMAVQSW